MAVKKATLPLRPCFAPLSHFIENLVAGRIVIMGLWKYENGIMELWERGERGNHAEGAEKTV